MHRRPGREVAAVRRAGLIVAERERAPERLDDDVRAEHHMKRGDGRLRAPVVADADRAVRGRGIRVEHAMHPDVDRV
jgi:hypothetical protein